MLRKLFQLNLFCDHYNLYNYRMVMIGIPFSQSTFCDTTIFGHMSISMGASEMEESSGIIWLRLPPLFNNHTVKWSNYGPFSILDFSPRVHQVGMKFRINVILSLEMYYINFSFKWTYTPGEIIDG